MSCNFFLSNPAGNSPLLHACHTPCPSYPYYLITLVISGDYYKSWSFLSSISLSSCVTQSYLNSNIFFSTRSSNSHWTHYFAPPSVEVDRVRTVTSCHLSLFIDKWVSFSISVYQKPHQDGSMSRTAPGLPSYDRIIKYISRSHYCYVLI